MSNNHETQTLARAGDYDLWPTFQKVVEEELNRLRDEMRNSPKFCDEDFTEDFRHKLGQATSLEWVLEIPLRARKQLEKEG